MKIKRFLSYPIILLTAFCFLQACGGKDLLNYSFEKVPPPFNRNAAVQDTVLPDGIEIYTVKKGTGQFDGVTFKDKVVVKLTGRTAQGEIFRSSYGRYTSDDEVFTQRFTNLYPHIHNNQPPIKEGLRKGITGMLPGGKRIIIVPAGKGEPRRTRNGIDLEGKTLVYNVELVGILTIPRNIVER